MQYHTGISRINSGNTRSKAGVTRRGSARGRRWRLKHPGRRYDTAAGTGRPAAVGAARGALRLAGRGAVSTSAITELLAQLPATLIRQGLKIPESLSQGLLLLRAKLPKAVKALPDAVTLLRTALLPLPKTTRGLVLLGSTETLPALHTAQEILLAPWRQPIPIRLEGSQQLALTITQLIPGHDVLRSHHGRQQAQTSNEQQ